MKCHLCDFTLTSVCCLSTHRRRKHGHECPLLYSLSEDTFNTFINMEKHMTMKTVWCVLEVHEFKMLVWNIIIFLWSLLCTTSGRRLCLGQSNVLLAPCCIYSGKHSDQAQWDRHDMSSGDQWTKYQTVTSK